MGVLKVRYLEWKTNDFNHISWCKAIILSVCLENKGTGNVLKRSKTFTLLCKRIVLGIKIYKPALNCFSTLNDETIQTRPHDAL